MVRIPRTKKPPTVSGPSAAPPAGSRLNDSPVRICLLWVNLDPFRRGRQPSV